MDITRVFTEEPEQELWRSLLQFSYRANILRHFDENHIAKTDEDDNLTNCIAGALLQADEYYKASKTVSLQVEPLLLYYGTTNLFYAMYILLNGTIPEIRSHGMHITVKPKNGFIAETSISFDHHLDGGVHVFSEICGFTENLCESHSWDLGEFLDSIAEIRDDFERCYRGRKSHIIPLYVIKTPDCVVERVFLDGEDALATLSMVDGFDSAYLSPQRASTRNGDSYLVLHHKMTGKQIHQISYSGQPYLQISHEKNGKKLTVPKELNMYVVLFALGNLCRYHPEIWNPFVVQDSTGEKLLVEKLLYYARRMLPNFVLNCILKKQVVFVSDKYVPEDRVHLVGRHEVQEIVAEEIRTQMRTNLAKTVMQSERSLE
ncbi:MAG: hypothetical protein IKE04_01030 [Oscillospiraceae bacterium]|nr:hypothetical protein [Oscillospiraceae bacterium]MBR6953486.1 hypothetical protein [Clostridia bacterium]